MCSEGTPASEEEVCRQKKRSLRYLVVNQAEALSSLVRDGRRQNAQLRWTEGSEPGKLRFACR